MSVGAALSRRWTRLGPRFLPFAESAAADLPMARLLRLSLFQVSVGMAVVLLVGTLNRVMIVELGVPAWLVALMVSLPLLAAPLRALIGFRSDNHRSVLGWRRVPYLWLGTLVQFGGLSIMPFALIILSGDTTGPVIIGQAAAALAFLLIGSGLHTTQTVGLALATDMAPEHAHPRVVILMCGMLLVGMVISAFVFGALLHHFSEIRLIQVVQGTAVVTLLLNAVALWKQEARDPGRTRVDRARPRFADAWRMLASGERPARRLIAVGLGTAAFSMDDILLEPYGGQVLHLGVGQTTALTATLALGSIAGFLIATPLLARRMDPHRIAAIGILFGLAAFSCVILSAPVGSAWLFGLGTLVMGTGGGLFAVGTLAAFMALARARGTGTTGLAFGVWGAVEAMAAGTAVAAGGLIRDAVAALGATGRFGPAMAEPAAGYGAVYHIELLLLFATLVALGPLVRVRLPVTTQPLGGLAGQTS